MRGKKKRPNKNLEPGQTPQRLKWRPRFRIIGFLSGLIGGVGAVLLVAQYGVAPLSRALSIRGLGGALFSGVLLPSTVFAIVVSIHNNRLDRAMAKARTSRPSPTMNIIILFLMAAVFVAPFLDTRTAWAEVNGPCGGEINGIDLSDVNSNAADAFEILEGDTVRGSIFVNGNVVGGKAGLTMFGFEVSGELESDSESAGREDFEFDYDDISWLGSGLIELWVDAELDNGQNCEIRFMINIDGNPLETVVGQAAAGAVAVGAVGMTVSGAGAVLEGGRTMDDLRKALVQLNAIEGPPLDVDLPDASLGSDSVTVAQGDSLWSISENELQNRLGRPPTDAETSEFWQSVIDANADSLQSGDPDLIMPGENITLPDAGISADGVSDAAGTAATPEPVSTDVAGVSAEAPEVSAPIEPDVTTPTEPSSDTSWWDADSQESRPIVQEGVGGAADVASSAADWGASLDATAVAGIAGLAAAVALVPANYLLLAKLSGTADPGVIDPRISAEVARQLAALPISDDARATLMAAGLERSANAEYDHLIVFLSIDFPEPSSVPYVTSWPPRVGTAIAWMQVAEQPPMSTTDLLDSCQNSAYVDNLIQGVGRNIALIEQKAAWPWTSS